MNQKSSNDGCCDSGKSCGGFNVEAVISVDERGQMVLPKDLRARARIQPGDKLALVSWERDGVVCCMSLIKTDALSEMVKGVLGPMMTQVGVS